MSQIGIWNLALAHLGDRAAVIDPNERSRQAELCRMFYPMARRSAIEAHDWGFATRVGLLAPAALAPLMGWTYAYSGPADAIKIVAVGHGQGGRRFLQADYAKISDADGNPTILTDAFAPEGVWTVDVEDVGKWSPLFVEAISYLLASYLAGPLITGDAGRAESRRLLQEHQLSMTRAAGSDANQQGTQRLFDFVPSDIATRGGTADAATLLNVRN